MPKVSVIVPCFNEQSTIRLLLDALRGQTFLRAAYYEFNARVREADGRIWLDPSMRSVSFARSTLLELI
jgi:hypothetical protein